MSLRKFPPEVEAIAAEWRKRSIEDRAWKDMGPAPEGEAEPFYVRSGDLAGVAKPKNATPPSSSWPRAATGTAARPALTGGSPALFATPRANTPPAPPPLPASSARSAHCASRRGFSGSAARNPRWRSRPLDTGPASFTVALLHPQFLLKSTDMQRSD